MPVAIAADREPIKDQRGGVVGEAFAFEDDEDSVRQCVLGAIANGATTSGGETMAPSTKPTPQGSPSSQCVAAATAQVVKMTQPMASRVIGRRLNLNSRQLMETPAE